jgi:hypothetical protein
MIRETGAHVNALYHDRSSDKKTGPEKEPDPVEDEVHRLTVISLP